MMRAKPRILIVDDEPQLAALMGQIFGFHGFDTLVFTSGAEALRALKVEPVDLILSDVRMPGVSGLDLLREVREHHPAIPVVLITGFADYADEELIRQGARAVFHKPVAHKDLLQAVKEIMGL